MADQSKTRADNTFEKIPPAGNNGAPHADEITAMGGASDGNSGGGNAAGSPDADTAQSEGGSAALAGDVQHDHEKLFPNSKPAT